jgi:hypothetical protein
MHAEFVRADVDQRHLSRTARWTPGSVAAAVLARVRDGSVRLGQRRSTP